MSTRARIVVLLCIVTLGARAAAAGEPVWVRVTTTNFVVYSDGGEKRARGVAERLEGFRALLASLFPNSVSAGHTGQVPVVAFRNDGAFKPYKPLYNGKPVNVAGLFLGGHERSLIALDASAWEGSSHVIFHEYIHKLMAASDVPIPLWFNEGIAEFYSTATTAGAKAQVGKVVPGHLIQLQERGLMPLEAFFSVKHDSPEYNERSRQGVFYAQSWAIVHYCVLDPKQQMQDRLIDFAARQGRGEPVLAAFKAAFGMEPAEMEKALKSYVRQQMMPVANMTFPEPLEVQKAVAEPASPAEVEYYLGNILALENRLDEAEPHFRRGAELDPASALPHEGLGLVALRRDDLGSARAAFAEATKRDSKNHLALYYFAAASMGSLDESTRPAVRAALERAVAIRPAFAGSYELLTAVALESNDLPGAASWAARGLKVDPQNGRIRLNLAIVQLREGKFDVARANLVRVIETSDDEGARSYARQTLSRLDEAPEPVPSSAGDAPADTPADAPADAPQTVVNIETATAPREPGLDDFHIRVAGDEVRGVVTRIDCTDRSITVHVLVDGKELAFTTEDTSTMIVATLGRGSIKHERFECGKALKREAFVQFDRTPGASAGVLKAILFIGPAK